MMKPMDDLQKSILKLKAENAVDVLSDDEKNIWNNFTEIERIEFLKDLLEKPVEFDNPVGIWYSKTKWSEALKAVTNKISLCLLEIASGANDIVPQTVARLYCHKDTVYTTVNLNKGLTDEFKRRTKQLPIKIDIIEDAAQKIEDYIGTEKIDVVVFEHSFNDIIEALLVERDGVDTINTDWLDILPEMVETVNREYLNKTLESSVKSEFLKIISSCLDVLKQDSFIIVNQFQFQYSLNVGMNPDLLENYLPITRKWITDAGLGEEIFFEGFESQWWMFLKKK